MKISPGMVSTIIPVFNRPDLLVEAVQSVVNQTYRPIEIIIVNDGSTDETDVVADNLKSQFQDIIRVIHKRNEGPGLSREAGRLIARGEFIQYLDSDDLLLPKKFELQVKGLMMEPEADVSYGKTRVYWLGDKPENIAWKRTGEKIDTMFPSFLKSRWWGTSTPLYRRKIIDQAGAWADLWNEEDWEYDCRIASQNVKLHYVPEFISDHRGPPGARLSRDGSTNPGKLKDRAEAHKLILGHAQKAGIQCNASEMIHFARELFQLSRYCGAAGLAKESRELFKLSRVASGEKRAKGLDFKLYNMGSHILGWIIMGKLACFSDKLR